MEQNTPIRPVRQNELASQGFEFLLGGRYVNPITNEDFTGKTFQGGEISVQGCKPKFLVKGLPSDSALTRVGSCVKVNMIKSKVGWRWVDTDRTETILISVHQSSKHFYALRVEFSGDLNLKTFPESPTEPRLRPIAYGPLAFGEKVGEIIMRGKQHPVFASITV